MCGVVVVEDVELALDENNLQSSVEVEADLSVLEHAVTEVSNLPFPFLLFLLNTKSHIKILKYGSLVQVNFSGPKIFFQQILVIGN